jgi:hypothetical protein
MTQRKRFDSAPVSELKIQMINDLLQSHPVNELWLKFVNLGNSSGNYKEREKVFGEYCIYRDLFLGLPPLNVPSVQGSHTKFRGGK